MWINLLDKIRNSLEEQGIRVIIGGIPPTGAEVDNEGVVILMRGEEEQSKSDYRECVVTFFMECWVRCDDKKLETGYVALSDFEEKVENIISNLRDNLSCMEENTVLINDNWQLLDVYSERKTGDMDGMRPLVGSQYTMIAKVYDVSEIMSIW